MNLIWHIVRKDLLRFRFILTVWVLLLAGKYFFFAAISGVFGHPSVASLRLFESPSALFFAASCVPAAIAYFLVAALVFEDPPAGRDPFWVTRPISGTQLFAAKFLFAFVMFVLAPVVAALMWWLACGFGAAEILPMAGIMGGAYLVLVLLGLGMASLANGYPRYFVWTLAGLAVVLFAHLVFSVLGFGHAAKMLPAFYFGTPAVCVAVISLEIAWQRFVIRHFRKSLPLIATLTLIGSAWLFTSPPAILGGLFVPAVPVYLGEENVRVSIAGDLRTFFSGGLSLALRVDGLPDDASPIVWMNAQWRSSDGKIWAAKGSSGASLQPLRRAAWRLLDLNHDKTPLIIQPITFALPAKYADRIASEAVSIEGTVRIRSSSARLLAEIPLAASTRRFTGNSGSFTINDYAPSAGEVGFLFTVRVSEVERWRGGYMALINRRTGEIIEPAREEQLMGGGATFNDVALAMNITKPAEIQTGIIVVSTRMRFKIPDERWLADSNLTIIGLRDSHELTRPIPTYIRPAERATPLLPKRFAVPTAVLNEYAGTYRPRPGATLSIQEKRGNLELADSGFSRVLLMPESQTSFYNFYASWLFAGDGYRVEFVRDAAGRVTHFVVHQDGRDFIVPRLPDKK